MNADDLLTAGRAEFIPPAARGQWAIRKQFVSRPTLTADGTTWPAGMFTQLFRVTDATLWSGGECVMSDDPTELRTHLDAAMSASGDVLVTGLGLGCVVRMLQQNERVARITVVEISADVIDLVWPHTPHDRIELVHADAFQFLSATDRTWDEAWHDIWTDESRGEGHLQIAHAKLMAKAHKHIRGRQGAWAMPDFLVAARERAIAEGREHYTIHLPLSLLPRGK